MTRIESLNKELNENEQKLLGKTKTKDKFTQLHKLEAKIEGYEEWKKALNE